MALADKKILTPIRYHQDNTDVVIAQANTMKALFDQGAEDLRVKLNGVIDELLATTGAQQIGIDPARGLGNTLADALTNIKAYMNLGASGISASTIGTGSGTTVQSQLEWLLLQIQDVLLDQIPDGTITMQKLATSLANTINGNTNSIGDLTTLDTTDKTSLVKAINEVNTQVETNNTQLAQVSSNESHKIFNNKNAALLYGTSINFVGDSITEGTRTLDFVNDGYVGIIKKAFQSEINSKAYGFVSFRDVGKLYGVNQYHTLTKLGFGDGTFDYNYAGGVVIESSTIGDYIEVKYTGRKARLIYSQMAGGGNVSIKLDGNIVFASLDTSGSFGFYQHYASSGQITADTVPYGEHTIRITKLDNKPTKLLGMIYYEDISKPYINNFGVSSLKLTNLTNNNLLDFYLLSGMTVVALGSNDEYSSADINVFKERITYICNKAVANKGSLIFCDFMFSLPYDNVYKKALRDTVGLYKQFALIDFGSLWFSDTTKNIDAKLLHSDGIHPTVEGHEFIANTLLEHMGLPYTKALLKKTGISPDLKTPLLLNSWVNFGAAQQAPRYYIDQDNIVHFIGMIKSGTTSAFTDLFELPIGYRPNYDTFFPAICDTGFAGITVSASGRVSLISSTNGWLSLNTVSYRIF